MSDGKEYSMMIRAGKILTPIIVATAISGCGLWQGSLLSAPSGTDDLAARHNKAGIQSYSQEQWDRAKEHFEAAVKVAPSLAKAHYNLGMVLYRQGKDAEAKPHFLKAAALAPENDVIQNAPPFSKVEAPSRSSGPSGMSDVHGHSH
jgi:tetratricopeptide (TPR) repeat protein